jgi:TRAP-type mannitol/chloroaromatic compound transport system substrate-binding protein
MERRSFINKAAVSAAAGAAAVVSTGANAQAQVRLWWRRNHL